tara:strand:- start:809 stop:1351 length:543 start_codon:yes stop_codon:yes gene_type:complete
MTYIPYKGDGVRKVSTAKKDAGRLGRVFAVKYTATGWKVKVEYFWLKDGEKSPFSRFQSVDNFVKEDTSWWQSEPSSPPPPPAQEEPPPPPAQEEPPPPPRPHRKTPSAPAKPSAPTESHYAVLGVSKTASDDEIKRAFRKLILKCHPDKGGNPEEFIKVRDSYDVLKSYVSRCRYDQTA